MIIGIIILLIGILYLIEIFNPGFHLEFDIIWPVVLIAISIYYIIKEEKLEITDKELDEKVEELAKQYNMTGEEVKKELGNVEYLRNDMLFQKAIDLLKENN